MFKPECEALEYDNITDILNTSQLTVNDGIYWRIVIMVMRPSNLFYWKQTANCLLPIRVPPMILSSGIKLIVPLIDDDEIDDGDLSPWKRKGGGYDSDADS